MAQTQPHSPVSQGQDEHCLGTEPPHKRARLDSDYCAKGETASLEHADPHPYPASTPLHITDIGPVEDQVQKRSRSVEDPLKDNDHLQKRRRTSPENSIVEDTSSQEAVGSAAKDCTDPIDYWRKKGNWPPEYFEQNFEQTFTLNLAVEYLLARKKSSSFLDRKRSVSGDTSKTPSDQKPREEKSTPYRDPRYKLLLITKGSFMEESSLGVADESKGAYVKLLNSDQAVPSDSLFRDDIFELTCRKVAERNEARVIQDISLLIVPSAETLATYGADHLECLIESVNEGWNNSIPIAGPRPQPDYSVGFKREAFSKDQLDKLAPFIGDWIFGDLSFFMATYYMYFPFLTCEVKCGAAGLEIADRQNTHSMTIAVRAVVELFRLVKRESEVHRQILAWSVSHDHRSVRIYGHYAVIDGKDTQYYRHQIHTFDFTALDGKERWTAYLFTRSVYDTWMPQHLKKICSAIDQLSSELDFGVAPLPEITGISQALENRYLSESDADSALASSQSQSILADQEVATPERSFQDAGAAKRLRKTGDAQTSVQHCCYLRMHNLQSLYPLSARVQT